MTPDAPNPNPQATAEAPLLAGRYQLLDKLGEGGMGTVYKARDTRLDRPVAVKVLPAGKLAAADAVARFRREAVALAKLAHPGIVQAFDSGQDGDSHFLVMELVEGRSLAKELAERGCVGPLQAADYAYQAALALDHAHRNGLIHRDVKPSNLLLTPDGRVKLLDLGLARFLLDHVGDGGLTREGAGMGTPDYAAPEQFRDARAADVRSDVYALGCTLYHLIAGRVPFPGSSMSEKVQAHETKEPTPLEELCPAVPVGLARVVRALMAKRPADRLPGMAAAADALAPYVSGASVSFQEVRNTAAWQAGQLLAPPPARRRRWPWLLLGAAASLLLAVGLVGVGYLLATHWGGTPVAQDDGKQPEPAPPEGGARPPGNGEKKDGPPRPPDDPDVLTVSQKPEDGGRFRTINEALAQVAPGQTIRVLDAATYAEAIDLRRPTAQKDITLEAVRGATIEVPAGGGVALHLDGVAGVTVRGFRLRGTGGKTALILAERLGPGVRLENLDLELPVRPIRPEDAATAVSVESHRVATGSPLTVRRCRFRGGETGVQLFDASGDSAGVAVHDNDFSDILRGVLVRGSWGRAAVAGNTFRGNLVGIQLEMLGKKPADVLLANNTFVDGTYVIRLADGDLSGGVAFRNNLVLDQRLPDMVRYRWDGRSKDSLRPGDGSDVARK